MARPLTIFLSAFLLLASCAGTPEPPPAPTAAPASSETPDLIGALRVDHDITDAESEESEHPIKVLVLARGVVVKKITLAPGESHSVRLPILSGNYEYIVAAHSSKKKYRGQFPLTEEHPTYTIKVSALKPAGELYAAGAGAGGARLLHGFSTLTLLTSEGGGTARLIPDPDQRFRNPEHSGALVPPSAALLPPRKRSIVEVATDMVMPGIVSSAIAAARVTPDIDDKRADPATATDNEKIKFDRHVPAAVKLDASSYSATPVQIQPEGVEIAIPETVWLPAGKWSVVWKEHRHEFDLAPGKWILVDYDGEPPTVRVIPRPQIDH